MTTAAGKKGSLPFVVVLALVVVLPFFGKGGMVAATILAAALLGAPLFVIIGAVTVLCFFLFAGYTDLPQYWPLVERIRSLADNPTLLAIPMFIMSGAVMSEGQISGRLIEFARSIIGWIPGGLAMSAVVACILFAAISGSSPATVVAIGSMMAPTLIKAGYTQRFSHGLVTSAGSLGILIPPSIPMIIYPIVNQGALIEVESLFASGLGPGLVMGAILMGFSFYRGLIDRTPRQAFELRRIGIALRDGFWALMFPILILGGIYSGLFNAVEAAAVSVVYAVVVEVWVHDALRLKNVPRIFFDQGLFLGALLVIMVTALAFSEFLEMQGIPAMMVDWIKGMNLEPWQFLLMLNVLLLVVGMAMDILSAMFVFVPLLAPVAAAMGVDPMHFGIIFIVNLEIGYLTPPVGLNLFVASALFDKPLGHVIRSVGPFIVLMLLGLGLVTYVPELSVGLGRTIMGEEAPERQEQDSSSGGGMLQDEEPDEEQDAGAGERSLEQIAKELEELRSGDGMLNTEQMMREAELQGQMEDRLDEVRAELEELRSGDGMLNTEQMMREAELQGVLDEYAPDGGTGGGSGTGAPDGGM
ncbi:MAG: TRAP transporter large permease subunit [Polyangiales bacterium]